jgi:hypothetical protein
LKSTGHHNTGTEPKETEEKSMVTTKMQEQQVAGDDENVEEKWHKQFFTLLLGSWLWKRQKMGHNKRKKPTENKQFFTQQNRSSRPNQSWLTTDELSRAEVTSWLDELWAEPMKFSWWEPNQPGSKTNRGTPIESYSWWRCSMMTAQTDMNNKRRRILTDPGGRRWVQVDSSGMRRGQPDFGGSRRGQDQVGPIPAMASTPGMMKSVG